MKRNNSKNVLVFRRDAEFFFKIGMRYAEKRMFEAALKYFGKAVELELRNPDYLFNFASILTELNEYERSNRILSEILEDIDPSLAECYFGIGCNYFELGDWEKARGYFEKYICVDPNGDYINEANGILHYLYICKSKNEGSDKAGDVTKGANGESGIIDRYTSQGEVNTRSPDAYKEYSELVTSQNDLSLMYFNAGEIDKSIQLAKSVLELNPSDIHANSNLALFYAGLGKIGIYEQQIEKLGGMQPDKKDDLYKLLHTFIKLDEHSRIIKLLVSYLSNNREPLLYHFLSVAFYNLKQYDSASDVWAAMDEFFPQYSIITDYYGGINQKTKQGLMGHYKMEYSNRLTKELEKEYNEKFNKYIRLDPAIFNRIWGSDKDLRNIVLYNLYEGDSDVKAVIINMFSKIKNSQSRKILRDFLEEKEVDEDIRLRVSRILGLKSYNQRDGGR